MCSDNDVEHCLLVNITNYNICIYIYIYIYIYICVCVCVCVCVCACVCACVCVCVCARTTSLNKDDKKFALLAAAAAANLVRSPSPQFTSSPWQTPLPISSPSDNLSRGEAPNRLLLSSFNEEKLICNQRISQQRLNVC